MIPFFGVGLTTRAEEADALLTIPSYLDSVTFGNKSCYWKYLFGNNLKFE